MRTLTTVIAAALFLSCTAIEVEAAKKSGSLSAEQRKKMHADGMKGCRKKYGSALHYVRVQKFYGRWAAVCYVYQ